MNQQNRPTVSQYIISCNTCKREGTMYFTNKESEDNTRIHQHCKTCNKITLWRLNMNHSTKPKEEIIEIDIQPILDKIIRKNYDFLKELSKN